MDAVHPILVLNTERQTEETLGKNYWISYTGVTWEVVSADYWHVCWHHHLQKH